jgi:hypothetical protein
MDGEYRAPPPPTPRLSHVVGTWPLSHNGVRRSKAANQRFEDGVFIAFVITAFEKTLIK